MMRDLEDRDGRARLVPVVQDLAPAGSARIVLLEVGAEEEADVADPDPRRDGPPVGTGHAGQAQAVAEVIQRTKPDVVLLNEFDFVPDQVAADLFRDNYLELSQNGAHPVEYPYYFVAPSNTGIPTDRGLTGAAFPYPLPGAWNIAAGARSHWPRHGLR